MLQLEFDIWGSIPFSQDVTSDPTAQGILLATRAEPRSVTQIADAVGADRSQVERGTDELAKWDLLVADDRSGGRWVANVPVYTAADLAVSEKIGAKYARIEADILRSSIPRLRELYESCEIAARFPWESMSLIVVGALLADFCVVDRVRFFPQYLDERFLPPLHPDGSRWAYVAYEKRTPRFDSKRWAFCQNVNEDGAGVGELSMFSYFDPPAQRRPAPGSLFDPRFRGVVCGLAEAEMSLDQMRAITSVDVDELKATLEDWSSRNPPAVSARDGRYTLNVPVFPRCDLERLVRLADAVAVTIHTEVTIPCQVERERTASELGLRFPMAESYLARDIALGLLVGEGLLSEIPDPPVPWTFGVWGWQGALPQWQDATRDREGT